MITHHDKIIKEMEVCPSCDKYPSVFLEPTMKDYCVFCCVGIGLDASRPLVFDTLERMALGWSMHVRSYKLGYSAARDDLLEAIDSIGRDE